MFLRALQAEFANVLAVWGVMAEVFDLNGRLLGCGRKRRQTRPYAAFIAAISGPRPMMLMTRLML